MKDRLHRRGFEDSKIEIIINKLKEQNLLDDTAFAQFWKETGIHSALAVNDDQVRAEKKGCG